MADEPAPSPVETVVHAVVLAGGRGRRLGRDKALLPRSGGRQVDHVVTCLGPLGGRIVIAHGARPLAVVGTVGVPDDPDRVGPLAGVVAGLRALEVSDDAPVALVAVDLVAPHAGLLRALAEHVRHDGLAGAMPVVGGRAQPLHGVVTAGLWRSLAADPGDRLVPALSTAGVVSVHEATWRAWTPDARPADDLDTPDDLATLDAAPGPADTRPPTTSSE